MEVQPHGKGIPGSKLICKTMSRTNAITKIIRVFLDGAIARMSDGFWIGSRSRAQVEVDSEELGRKLFMNWAQVRELADSGTGLTIGSHAHSHRELAELDR